MPNKLQRKPILSHAEPFSAAKVEDFPEKNNGVRECLIADLLMSDLAIILSRDEVLSNFRTSVFGKETPGLPMFVRIIGSSS